MSGITLDLSKSLEENASVYFEKAKKIRKKMEGARVALEKNEKTLADLMKKKKENAAEEKEKKKIKNRKKEWYEKFRWFRSSDGFLVVGGRDATSNEVLLKKHAEKDDLVFHTDMAGSPFFVVKAKNKKIPKTTIKEASDATATFSKAWKLGLHSSDVFHVSPEQVSKTAKSGEFLQKGAFMIHGKTEYVDNTISLAVGAAPDHAVMAGPVNAVKRHCASFVVLSQGDEKASTIAKKIRQKLRRNLDLDEIIRALPAGGFKMAMR